MSGLRSSQPGPASSQSSSITRSRALSLPWEGLLRRSGTREGFYNLLDRKASLLTVITPEEAPVLRDRLRLDVNIIEGVKGFSLTKGQNHALQFAVLRRPPWRLFPVRNQRHEPGTLSNRS